MSQQQNIIFSENEKILIYRSLYVYTDKRQINGLLIENLLIYTEITPKSIKDKSELSMSYPGMLS